MKTRKIYRVSVFFHPYEKEIVARFYRYGSNRGACFKHYIPLAKSRSLLSSVIWDMVDNKTMIVKPFIGKDTLGWVARTPR